MTIILVSLALLAAGLLIFHFLDYDWEGLGVIFCLAGGLGLIMCAMTIPLKRMQWRSKFVEVEAIRQSRTTDSEIEAAAWRMKVAEVNAELASGRYYNRTVFDIWIPDEVESMEPIQ